MAYTTVTEMLAAFDPQELVQVSDRATPALVTVQMLKIAAAGGDMSIFTAEEQAATAAAKEVIECAITDAEWEIDPYLRGRYVVPMNPPHRMLTVMARDIARYRLYGSRVTEEIANRYKAAVNFLKMVAEGKVALGDLAAATPSAPGSNVKVSAPDRVFTNETLKDYL